MVNVPRNRPSHRQPRVQSLYLLVLPTTRDQTLILIYFYIARTRPGTDFPTRFETLLSQTQGNRPGSEPAGTISESESESESPIRVTVREVLKYSLTWVIIPSETVHACTHEMLRLTSQPSTITVLPKETTD